MNFRQIAIALEAETLYARHSQNVGIYRNDSHSREAAWKAFLCMGWIH